MPHPKPAAHHHPEARRPPEPPAPTAPSSGKGGVSLEPLLSLDEGREGEAPRFQGSQQLPGDFSTRNCVLGVTGLLLLTGKQGPHPVRPRPLQTRAQPRTPTVVAVPAWVYFIHSASCDHRAGMRQGAVWPQHGAHGRKSPARS